MPEEEEEIETLLKTLNPAEPSGDLKERIGRRLHASEARSDHNRNVLLFWGSLAVAACLLLVFSIRFMNISGGTDAEIAAFEVDERSAIGAAEMDAIELVSTTNALVAARQSPVFYLETGVPAREIYLKYMDTYNYRHHSFEKPIVVTYPREEIRVIPAISD